MIALLVFILMGHAAPHPQFPDAVSRDSVRSMIATAERSDEIKRMGPQAYKHLREIMFTANEKVEHRWNATLVLAQIGGSDSLPDVEKALKDSSWFMRSAGLLATSLIDKRRGYAAARNLMSRDPALLVRASALQVLAQDTQLDRGYLWKELYNPLNFNGGHGLSIRQSILKVLGQNAQRSEAGKFSALMRDADTQVQALAEAGLKATYKR
jgi:hypothetical protein